MLGKQVKMMNLGKKKKEIGIQNQEYKNLEFRAKIKTQNKVSSYQHLDWYLKL